MYCRKCNRENPEGNNFCEYCGVRLETEEERPKKLTEEQNETEDVNRDESKKRSRWAKLILGGMCGLVLTVLIVAIVLNSTSSSDELDDDNDTGDNTYAGDTIMLDDGTNISSNQIYILSGIDGSVDEKTTMLSSKSENLP